MSDTQHFHAKALPVGTVLREWKIESVLGSGGFGIVYKGSGVYFGETVAIKEYLPGAISDRRGDQTVTPLDTSSQEIYQHGLQKFVDEAKILWNLSKPERHPNIVCVRSLFEINGTAYMVMDFESGVSLSKMLKDGRKFTEAELLALIKPVAQGLERAHSFGVFHRDIKPANILVSEDGRPVLIDFGSARFDSGQVTSTKVTFYTPPYAAIEQYVRTFPQGPWTDIYALGVTMYQCITGEKPGEVLERLHGGGEQSLAQIGAAGFSRTVLEAIDWAMQIKPADRPQSISDWLDRLEGRAMRPAPPRQPVEDDVTRVAQPMSSAFAQAQLSGVRPAAPLPPPAPAAAAPHDLAGVIPAADTLPTRKAGRTPLLVAGGLVALVVAAGVAGVALLPKPSKAAAEPASASAPPPPAPAPLVRTVNRDLAPALGAAADAATGLGRPEENVLALREAATRIEQIAASALNLPANDPKSSDMANEIDQLAAAAAAAYAQAIKKDAGVLAKAVTDDLAAGSSQPKAFNATQAKELAGQVDEAASASSRLEAALLDAASPEATVATAALAEIHTAFSRLSALRPAAAEVYLKGKRAEFGAISGEIQKLQASIHTLAAVKRPAVFASRQKKDAHKQLQDLDALATSTASKLQTDGASVASANRRTVTRLVAQAATARADLERILKTAEAHSATLAQ